MTLRAKDVIRLHMGHYTVPHDFPRAPDLQGAAIVVTAFLVRHPGGPILLDTGFATGHAKAEALWERGRLGALEVAQFPFQTGFRFSMNARTPSRKSSLV